VCPCSCWSKLALVVTIDCLFFAWSFLRASIADVDAGGWYVNVGSNSPAMSSSTVTTGSVLNTNVVLVGVTGTGNTACACSQLFVFVSLAAVHRGDFWRGLAHPSLLSRPRVGCSWWQAEGAPGCL
jgi:hypothetical protein